MKIERRLNRSNDRRTPQIKTKQKGLQKGKSEVRERNKAVDGEGRESQPSPEGKKRKKGKILETANATPSLKTIQKGRNLFYRQFKKLRQEQPYKKDWGRLLSRCKALKNNRSSNAHLRD